MKANLRAAVEALFAQQEKERAANIDAQLRAYLKTATNITYTNTAKETSMATKPSRAATEIFTADPVPDDIADPELPEGLDVEDPFPEGAGASAVEDALIASVLGQEESAEAIRKRQAALYLEAGAYRWIRNETLNVKVSFSATDIQPTDLAQLKKKHGKGRCFIRVTGQVESKEKKRGNFEFSASPDVRIYKERGDQATKTYEMLTKLYFAKHEKNPTPLEVVEMLKQADYVMHITLGNDRNFLNRFSAE